MPASAYSYVPKPSAKSKKDDGKSFLDAVASAFETARGPAKLSGPIPFTRDASATEAPAKKPRREGPMEGTESVNEMVRKARGERGIEVSPEMATRVAKKVEDSVDRGAPRARIVEEDEVVQSFFAKTHGSAFNPSSRADRAKMDKILGMVNANPELLNMSPGKFAMKVYASK